MSHKILGAYLTLKEQLIVYLTFKFNWVFCMLCGNPTPSTTLYYTVFKFRGYVCYTCIFTVQRAVLGS